MRRRASVVWGLCGTFAFAVVLVFACHPVALAAATAGMSAPPAPAASLESASPAHLAPTPFHPHALVFRGSHFALTLAAARANLTAPPQPRAVLTDYGPLHRRPPPSFS